MSTFFINYVQYIVGRVDKYTKQDTAAIYFLHIGTVNANEVTFNFFINII
jgi:hypothetical protein